MIKISINKPLLVAVVFTVLTLGGLLCYNLLNFCAAAHRSRNMKQRRN